MNDSVSVFNQQYVCWIWSETSPQRAVPCMQVMCSGWKHYMSSDSIMEASVVDEERGLLWCLSQFRCGKPLLSWSQLELKSVIEFDPCYTPISSFKFKKAFFLFYLGTCCSMAATLAGWEQSPTWRGWRQSEGSPSCEIYYLELERKCSLRLYYFTVILNRSKSHQIVVGGDWIKPVTLGFFQDI